MALFVSTSLETLHMHISVWISFLVNSGRGTPDH